MSTVPELSYARWRHGTPAEQAQFQAELLCGLQRYGFIILRDHDVPTALLDHAYELVRALFALPDTVKRRHCGGLRGYTPFGTEHAKDSRFPDLKEFWQIGRERMAVGARRISRTVPAAILRTRRHGPRSAAGAGARPRRAARLVRCARAAGQFHPASDSLSAGARRD
jgi:isopenicillin N synthase-like dioxygenase